MFGVVSRAQANHGFLGLVLIVLSTSIDGVEVRKECARRDAELKVLRPLHDDHPPQKAQPRDFAPRVQELNRVVGIRLLALPLGGVHHALRDV